ncbi:MAG: hypothetical protein ACT4ON_09620 [Bacteroidota bacterium]
MKKFSVLFILIFSFEYLSAQVVNTAKVDPFAADQKFSKGNYEGALDDYLSLLENDTKNEKYTYNIAVCYLNTNINKTKAIPYLEIITRKPKYDPNAMYLLGRAYHFAYRFDDAIKAYTAFKQTGKGKSDNLADSDREIQFCINAKELMKFPLNVKFENLGGNVNSPYPDYYSFVPNDESYIVFNTRRPNENVENLKEDGTYPPAVYIAKSTEGTFIKAKNIGAPITKEDGEQEVIGLSATGDAMLLYYTNSKGVGDIYMTTTDKNKSFKTPEKLDENINSPKASEIAACLSNDGSMLYFASNRLGGSGGTDLYVSRKLPNGKWGPPLNLGPEINTPQNEDFPTISADGKIFYFSSNGHTSIGGYDIFKAEMDETAKQYVNPKNVGYPINTPEDNFNFRLSSTGRYGYMAALREGGLGDMDIYRVTFNEVEPKYSVVKGNISSADSTKKLNLLDVFISVADNKTQEVVGNYLPNPNSGNYVMVLAPGTYDISIEANGFQTMSEKISVLDKNSFKFEITRNIQLNPEK